MINLATISDQIEKDRKAHSSCEMVDLYRQYSKGYHLVTLTSKQKTILRNLLTNRFSDNVCHQIVFEAASRIKFEKWTCSDEKVNKYLENLRLTSRIRKRQADIFYDTLRDGNHVVAVNWDTGSKSVKIYREEWWDGVSGIFIAYGDDDEPVYAVKEWQEDGPNGRVYRRLIRDHDSLVRMRSMNSGQSWEPFKLDTDPKEGGPIMKWTATDGTPLGLPYIHLTNGNRQSKNYGDSELCGGVIGFQDQVNDIQYAMSACGRLTAYQMYYASGVKLKKDAAGNDIKPEMAPGNWMSSTDPNSRFGVLPAGDIGQLLALHDKKLRRMAQMTQTPYHSITGGDWPSGDALLRAELPAVGKAERQIQTFEESFGSMAVLAIRIYNRFSGKTLNVDVETAPIEPQFADPEKRDILSRSAVVHNMATNISKREALRILGVPETRIEAIIDEMKDEMELVAPPAAFGNQTSTTNSNEKPTPEKGPAGGHKSQ